MNRNIIIKRSIQIIIGILFLLSGILKAIDSQQFVKLVHSYGIHWAADFAPIFSGIEIVLGLYMILDVRVKSTAIIVGLLTLGFSGAFGYAFFVNHVDDCGCMGSFITFPPVVTFLRNILIVFGCFWLWKYGSRKASKNSSWKIWIINILGIFAFCLTSYTIGVKIVNYNKIKAGESVNAGLLRFFSEKIGTGISFVFIFNPDCPHCWNMTENVKSIKRIPEFSNVIGITSKNADTSSYMKEMKPNFEVYKYPTDELTENITEVPILLYIVNGKIMVIFKVDEIPCGNILKHDYEGKPIVY